MPLTEIECKRAKCPDDRRFIRLSDEKGMYLVWSMPMPKLSYQFELSDVGLRKICVKHQIPQW